MSKTYGEQFKEALACKTKEEAQAWFERELFRYKTDFNVEAEEAKRVILVNLGYMAGYYDHAVADKMYELFGAVHPIFGRTEPTAEEALEAGKKLAARP